MGCLNDDSIGPVVRGCRDDFDFTVGFENVFFTIVPAAAFLVIGLGRALILRRRRPIVRGFVLQRVKLVSVTTLFLFHFYYSLPKAMALTRMALRSLQSPTVHSAWPL